MSSVTLEQLNETMLTIKHELEEIKKHWDEDDFELSEETKKKIEASRKKSISKMKSQEEIEKRFL